MTSNATPNTTLPSSVTHAIDDNDVDTTKQQIFHDGANNFTFTLTRKNGTAYISPLETKGLTELKIGVLLPFHQKDNEWTKTITLSGASAIRMAVAEINTRGLIAGAYITLIEQDSYPKEVQGQAAITQAIYSTVSLVHEGVIAVIGDISSSWTSLSALMTSTLDIPQCSFSASATALSDKTQYPSFFRTIPTDLIYADAALAFISNQQWTAISVLFSGDDFGKRLSKDVIMKARDHNIAIKGYQSFFDGESGSDIQRSIDALMGTGARVIFVAATDDAPLAALITAAHSGYINSDNVWLTIGVDTNELHQSVIKFNDILSMRTNNSSGGTLNNSGNNSTNSSGGDPLTHVAQTTQNLTPIQYNSSFSGGIFSFDTIVSIPGYAPFDQFLQKWASLDSSLYPYGGQRNISGNEGYAYSCMMTMAEGFNNIIKNSTNATTTLNQLAYRQLGATLSLSAFNTSFVGPEGPINLDENGDMSIGNYRIYNIQNGTNVNIGNIIAGQLHLTSPPIYYNGTTNVPAGVPPKVFLNPGYSTPLSIILATVSAIGTLLAVISMCLVVAYRKRDVFKMASPLFCVLELMGFILCYASVLFFIGGKSRLSCIVFPVTLNLGWSLVLGNLIAKNYRIYHVFNNIFITRTLVGNKQLLKISGGIVLGEMVILVLWLCLCTPQTLMVSMPGNSYYVDCFYNGPSDSFVTLLTLIAACELSLAAFLAFNTRSVGKNYSKYSEYKQIALSIYNIIFSALIGVVAFFLPTTDYYTQHFLVATMIVWATTFCLFTLFLPKFLRFRKPTQDAYPVKNKIADLPGRQQSSSLSGHRKRHHHHHQQQQNHHQQQQSFGELLSMNGVLNGGHAIQNNRQPKHNHPQYQLQHRQIYHRTCIASAHSSKSQKTPQQNGTVLDAYEAQMPMQRVLKYMPFLSSWKMQQMVLMPQMSYFSYFSDCTRKGDVFGYSHATIVSSEKEAHLLKVHGRRFHDILIQVENGDDLQQWYKWFNSTPGASDSSTLHRQQQKSSNHRSFFIGSRNSDISNALSSTALGKALSPTTLNRPVIDSGMTTRHLLASDDDEISNRQNGSCITLATLDSMDKLPTFNMTEIGTKVLKTTRGSSSSSSSVTATAAAAAVVASRQGLDPLRKTTADSIHQDQSALQTPTHATGSHTPPFVLSSNLNTPSSEDRTMVCTPCMDDDDAIMMSDL